MWDKIVNNLSNKLTQPQYESWIKPIKYVGSDEQKIYLAVPNEYFKNWISRNLSANIIEAAEEESGQKFLIDIQIDIDLEHKIPSVDDSRFKSSENHSDKAVMPDQPVNQNFKYTFDSFVVGPNNTFAYNTAIAAGEKPGRAYNPLYLYGGVGLGKTHLMRAIGHRVLQKYPSKKVRYLSVEKFTNELIDSIRRNTSSEFRIRYREIDVLLLDDVQFLGGKQTTQEELFNTFNTLHEEGKQIVLSSDRPPKQIKGLEERLVSRFEWGITVDIQPPEFETRIAILRNKVQYDNMNVPYEILELIAAAYQNNIRELEGALNKVVTYVAVTGCPMTADAVRNLIDSTSKVKKQSPDQIIEAVSEYFKVSPAEIKGSSRMKEISHARQIAIYLTREITRQSFPNIGEAFGKKHSTIIYAYDKIKEDIKSDPSLSALVSDIMRKVT